MSYFEWFLLSVMFACSVAVILFAVCGFILNLFWEDLDE